jgi:hypothetical protein
MPSFSGVFTLPAQMQAIAAGLWTAPPGAPTIGTATGGNASASVTFTAPANLGVPAGITSFTVTSSPSGITGTGASSPITVSGLSNGTAYTFTVTATGASGTGPASAASNSVTPAMQPGDAYGGGFFAGQINVSSVIYNLVVGPKATAYSSGKQFRTSTPSSDPTSVIDGPANSATMNSATYPAAEFCEGLTVGGFTDWYMPAKNELEVCYFFLKPETTANNTSWGSNANAVSPEPVSTNYTSGAPAQTSATVFKTGNAESYETNTYWSSTESSSTQAWSQGFSNGTQNSGYFTKTSSLPVRAVRRVAA